MFKAAGTVGADQALQARVELAHFNLADRQPELAGLDPQLIAPHPPPLVGADGRGGARRGRGRLNRDDARKREPKMAMTHDEIYKKTQDVLVDALGVDEEDVVPTASLRADLGAESIDFLDITFRLEKAFSTPEHKFTIPKGELFPDEMDSTLVQDNKLTDAGLAEVRRRLPHADLSQLEASRDVALIPDLFAVQDIVDYLERKGV